MNRSGKFEETLVERGGAEDAATNGRTNNTTPPLELMRRLKEEYIEFLVSSGQLDFNQAGYRTPPVVADVQRVAGISEVDIEKPPFKLKAGLKTASELAKTGDILTSWIAAEGVQVPSYIGGPSDKAAALAVATAMEMHKYTRNNPRFIFDKKEGSQRVDVTQLLKSRNSRVVGGADMPVIYDLERLRKFAHRHAEWIRNRPEYFDAIASEGMGLVGSTALLKTLYDEHPGDPTADKRLIQVQIEDGAPSIRGDVRRGDTTFVVRYTHPGKKGFYGDIESADNLLVLDDSVVSYRTLQNFMRKLKSANPRTRVTDIMVPIAIEELSWMREGFDRYMEEEWNGSAGDVRIHVLTTSKEIIDYVHKRGLSIGGEPLVNDVAYQRAQSYFKRMEDIGKKVNGYG